MDALAAAAAKRRQCNPPTSSTSTTTTTTPSPTSPSTPASRPSALSINFLVESSSSPYFVEEEEGADAYSGINKQVVVDEQLRAPTPNKIVQQDEADDDGDDAPSTATTAQRVSPFYHLLNHHHQQTTSSALRSGTSLATMASASAASPCLVLPRPVRPNLSTMPAYPPLHTSKQQSPTSSTSSSSSSSTTTTTTTATYPYPAFYPLASFASVAAGVPPIDATPNANAATLSSPANGRTSLPPVPVLTTPAATSAAPPPVIDLQFLSQLYMQASPYLLAGGLLPAASAASSATASMVGHQAMYAAQPGQPTGYLPYQLQQQVFQQALALAHLHPLHASQQQQHHQQQQQTRLSPPPSTQQASGLSPRSSPAHSPAALVRSIDRRSVPSQSHHSIPTSGSDRTSVLEAILTRAERQALEEERGTPKRERSRYDDDEQDLYGDSVRNKRRRTDSTGSDGEYSPYGVSASSSGSGSSDDDEATAPRRRLGLAKPNGVVGTGMKEMLYKRRQASPKQVVLLEQVFAVEPIPTSATKLRLSEVLNMSPKRVTVWFKNKRARQKKKGIPLPSSSSSAYSSPTTTTTPPSTSSSSSVTLSSVRTSPIDRKFATTPSSSSSSPPLVAPPSPPSARRRGDAANNLTFHYFGDRHAEGGNAP